MANLKFVKFFLKHSIYVNLQIILQPKLKITWQHKNVSKQTPASMQVHSSVTDHDLNFTLLRHDVFHIDSCDFCDKTCFCLYGIT